MGVGVGFGVGVAVAFAVGAAVCPALVAGAGMGVGVTVGVAVGATVALTSGEGVDKAKLFGATTCVFLVALVNSVEEKRQNHRSRKNSFFHIVPDVDESHPALETSVVGKGKRCVVLVWVGID